MSGLWIVLQAFTVITIPIPCQSTVGCLLDIYLFDEKIGLYHYVKTLDTRYDTLELAVTSIGIAATDEWDDIGERCLLASQEAVLPPDEETFAEELEQLHSLAVNIGADRLTEICKNDKIDAPVSHLSVKVGELIYLDVRGCTVYLGRYSDTSKRLSIGDEGKVMLNLGLQNSDGVAYCRIVNEDGNFYLQDMNSSTGTWVDGQQVFPVPSGVAPAISKDVKEKRAPISTNSHMTELLTGSVIQLGACVQLQAFPGESKSFKSFDSYDPNSSQTCSPTVVARRRVSLYYIPSTPIQEREDACQAPMVVSKGFQPSEALKDRIKSLEAPFRAAEFNNRLRKKLLLTVTSEEKQEQYKRNERYVDRAALRRELHQGRLLDDGPIAELKEIPEPTTSFVPPQAAAYMKEAGVGVDGSVCSSGESRGGLGYVSYEGMSRRDKDRLATQKRFQAS
eukprot:GHVL01019942.1.p1 GENE.GHVL01019942.1~~GHVL01019942.1.p1  ORF type:complete len:450 (+),score=62.45 GHVL01019942.1:838-2187(+)